VRGRSYADLRRPQRPIKHLRTVARSVCGPVPVRSHDRHHDSPRLSPAVSSWPDVGFLPRHPRNARGPSISVVRHRSDDPFPPVKRGEFPRGTPCRNRRAVDLRRDLLCYSCRDLVTGASSQKAQFSMLAAANGRRRQTWTPTRIARGWTLVSHDNVARPTGRPYAALRTGGLSPPPRQNGHRT